MEGGLLERSIEESVYQLIVESLQALGWFNPGREHSPIVPTTEPVETYESIPTNLLVVNIEVSEDSQYELGQGPAIEDGHTFYVDFYAEDLSVGRHVSGDVRAILRGTAPSIGRTINTVDIYDYEQATPPVIAVGVIEDVRTEKPSMFSRPWKQRLFSTAFVVFTPTEVP